MIALNLYSVLQIRCPEVFEFGVLFPPQLLRVLGLDSGLKGCRKLDVKFQVLPVGLQDHCIQRSFSANSVLKVLFLQETV